MRFADYFGRAFAGVSAAQFPWVKTFKESPVSKIAEVSLSFSLNSEPNEGIFSNLMNYAIAIPSSIGQLSEFCAF